MDVAAWLCGLGLEQYAPAFRDNDVDGEVLPKLTADDLIGLGVTSIGHRRKLLDAIAALGTEPLTGAQSATSAISASTAAPTIDAERRQLTVMFCDLVGSTALSSRLDPEDLREIIGAYHRAVAEAVAGFDGFVAKYMGDGVLIYFGYPQAHEDDAERAVRSGLAVIEAVGRLPAQEGLNVRLGIATGLAVVGDLIGEGAAQERGIVGETPNLAARLQALAAPDTLVIGEATRRQIGELFDLEDLGPQQLAGFAEPQRCWRLLGESGAVSRFEALRSGETPLVGREEEIELLVRRWQQAKSGEGRVVLISGEPGIGKSRLTAALSEHMEAERHTRLRYFCSPHHQDSALYPFIAQLERAAGFTRNDTVDARLGKLRTLVAPGMRDDDDIALLSGLLSLPSKAAELNLSPQRKREKLLAALLNQLEAEAGQRPVLVVFEDAHWIDPTSRELLDLIVDRVYRLPVLLAITFRPEFQPPWAGRSHVTSLVLNRLGEREGEALVHSLAGNAGLTAEMVAEIVERTDGVPLFVEELTKAVLESAEQGNRVATVLATASQTALLVPATLHASLMARLDRLGPSGKEVAQIGAVLGREFGYDLIEPVAQRPERELQAALAQLSAAGLLFCRGVTPHASYLFKHALVQDAAYSTLLRGRRQELHARVAAALEMHFPDLIERQPELLAQHLAGAGAAEQATAQWLKAGRRSAARSVHAEAIAYFGRGLTLLGTLPASPERDGREIALQLARAASLLATQGMASAGAAEAYARALDIAERRNDANSQFTAMWGLWFSNQGSNLLDEARGLSDKLLILTRNSSDDGQCLQAHHAAWTTNLFRGEPVRSHEHCEAGRLLYEPERHRSHAQIYGGHDPGVCARYVAGWAEWFLGYPDRAQASVDDALLLAEELGQPSSLLFAHIFGALVGQFRRQPERSLRCIVAAEGLAAEQRLALFLDARVMRGGVLAAEDEIGDAVVEIREGLAARQQLPNASKLGRPYGLGLLCEVMRRAGDHAGALAAVTEGLAATEESGERWWEPELHRLRGLLLMSQGALQEAQGSLQQALRIAQNQQAKSLELRAATSLARLWGEQRRREEARELLAPIYGWFTEGFDTADLKEARALLDELV